MSKIICEICGTAYPDTESRCPICGWTQEGIDFGDELEQSAAQAMSGAEGGKEAQEEKTRTREIFDYDAVNEPEANRTKEVSGDDDDEELEEEDEERRTNPFVVIILTIVIVALLAAIGYVVFRYLRAKNATEVQETTAATEEATTEDTVPTVPCTGLSLQQNITTPVKVGQLQLLNVVVIPEDTTDVLTYTSSDESIATVNEEGRVTAVAEGEATITISCGDKTLECVLVVNNEQAAASEAATETTEETEATDSASTEATEETEATGTTDATEATDTTEATDATDATEAAAESTAAVTLKLKKTDITFGVQGVYTTLELDCDLSPEDVEWSTSNSSIAVVENGKVTAIGSGIAKITAKYGDQTVECIVRCNF